ncbi:MAG: arylesterase [Alphaproteobacteria bacterium]
MRFLTLILGLFLVCQVQAADTYRLMVFGDSLSAGYRLPVKEAFYTRLEMALHEKGYKNVAVLNASRSGETTTGGLQRFNTALRQKPDAVILELGINDALQGVAVETIQQNLEILIDSFLKNQIPVMLIGMQLPPLHNPAYSQNFAKMYQTIAKKYQLVFYPFFMKDVIRLKAGALTFDTTYVLSDNVHPNAAGVQIMVDNVLPDVITFLRQNGVKK